MANYRALLICGVLVGGGLGGGGCGKDHGGGDADAGAGSSAIMSLEVKPPMQTVGLTAAGSGYAASQDFAVIATYADGTMGDVTALADWDSNDENAVVFGGATATVSAAGSYKITAEIGGVIGNAVLDATLIGTTFGTGFDPADQAMLDATPDGSQTPTVAYPLAGSLFPVNVAPIEVHAQKSDPAQAIARVTFTDASSLITYSFYAPCTASPNPGTFANACIVSITGGFATQLAGVSETDDIQLKVRLCATDGTKLGESAATAMAWSKTPLTGGLYYWTTAGTGDTTFNTAIARYDFDGDTSTPTLYLSSANAPTVPSGQTQCVGCHAVSPDGTKMSFSLGGSLTGFFSLYDVASVTPTYTNMTGVANMSTFSPDGSREVTGSYGVLTLRDANSSLTDEADNLFTTTVTEKMSHATWSASGNAFAFVSWVPTAADISSSHDTGDMVQGGQIWITSADSTGPSGTPTLLVPRATGVTSYYPNISDDDQYVVFNQSSCAGPANGASDWGSGACDGYNDISATLMIVPSAGGAPIPLTNANGSASPITTNSWPRWSPDHGTFRGKKLYWVAFSSRRAYGLSLASGAGGEATKPQLWFAAVAVDADGTVPTSDPSFSPVWLPGQDPNLTGPRGNHTPAWTSKAVVIE